MAKKNKKEPASSSSSSSSGKKGAAAKKCTCDHPFNCECGNRPERPSRGHKWDMETQQWGGKGHRQKGGSGQTSQVGQAAKTTVAGNTQIAQWQSMPSGLLRDYCTKQKRPPPKFKELLNDCHNHKFKTRCIVPDSKDPDKDLIIIPAHVVANEEQAKEEAALLALLVLTPNIPHERKLPEPYKTTWLTAIQAQRNSKSQSQSQSKKSTSTSASASTYNANNPNNRSSGGPTSNNSNHRSASSSSSSAGATPKYNSNNNSNNRSSLSAGAGATPNSNSNSNNSRKKGDASSNTNLVLSTSHISTADKRKQREAKNIARNVRIRKHEAIRMANRDHPVFLSAKLRQQIQQLLQGNDAANLFHPKDGDNEDTPLEAAESDRQAYVEERLHREGFTQRQARTAFDQHRNGSNSNKPIADQNNEEEWDRLYDECLQWLCVHLPESQLPEGFDPRGQTLEVVAAPGGNKSSSTTTTPVYSVEAQQVASKYGLSNADGAWLLSQQKGGNSSVEDEFWNRICQLANVFLPDAAAVAANANANTNTIAGNPVDEEAAVMVQEEMEALEAIFPGDCHLTKRGKVSTITIRTPEELTLTIVYGTDQYPSVPPQRVLVSGNWPKPHVVGASFHVKIAKFMSTLTVGEPMVFEIYGHMQLLVQTIEELPEAMSLSQNKASISPSVSSTQNANQPSGKTPKVSSKRPKLKSKRPRERGVFWSARPENCPPAMAYPKIRKSLELQRRGLPAGRARQDFLSKMQEADSSSRVMLVTGDTGCGKTTQIPQFILEEAPKRSKIVVAQPRRLAATGVAARVAEERGEDKPGTGSVGYVVRGASAISKSTRLLFCTFGILLRQLQREGALDCVTHIVIDEVHERNLDGDILMGLLKQCLKTTPHLRVVLMSATLDADRFAAYWGKNTPRMHIPGRTFPVEDYMLEDVLEMTGYMPPKKRKKNFFSSAGNQQQRPRKATPWNDSELSDKEDEEEEDSIEDYKAVKSTTQHQANQVPLEERVKRVDEAHIDYDMLGQLVRRLILDKTMGNDGSILVFLPGAPEINQAKNAIGKITGGLPILLLPLHGGLQPKDQNIIFSPSPSAVKVILSTNIAETSITIPDCTVVIDSCREKQSSYDPVNRMPLLVEHFASQASLKQRRGRAGRVRQGKCYKLISKCTYAKLTAHAAPEITRCALDQTLLSLLFLGVERGNGNFLRTLLDPPPQLSVDAAAFSLWKIGALERLEGNELQLTPLGMHLAGIPAPPVVGKMLVMGSILGCRRAALAMAAGISNGRSPFMRVDAPRGKKQNSDEDSPIEMKQRRVLEERGKLFEISGNSDHAMLAAAFMNWEGLSPGGGERKKYCDKLGLSFTGMRDILQLVNQYDSSLSAAGYGKSAESDRNERSWRVLRTCAISAMAPGQLVRVHRPSTKYASTAEGAREKDGVAKELKFFMRQEDDTMQKVGNSQSQQSSKEDRVFIHPSSALFSVGNYSCPWLVFHSMVKTSKPFLRDATECSAYALLLFGGNLDVEARNSIIVVDGWVKLSANARIGALIRGLRGKMDDLLAQKIKDPTIAISDTPEMNLIVNLLFTDGLGS